MARPPKDGSEKLTKTVAFRLTEGDYQRLNLQAVYLLTNRADFGS